MVCTVQTMANAAPPPGDEGPELFARKAGEDRRRPTATRGRRRLDTRFAAYLAGQIAPCAQPDPQGTIATYRASARDLSRPRLGVLADEQA